MDYILGLCLTVFRIKRESRPHLGPVLDRVSHPTNVSGQVHNLESQSSQDGRCVGIEDDWMHTLEEEHASLIPRDAQTERTIPTHMWCANTRNLAGRSEGSAGVGGVGWAGRRDAPPAAVLLLPPLPVETGLSLGRPGLPVAE